MLTGNNVERIDLSVDKIPERWYNVIPDLPRSPERYLDPNTKEPVSDEYLERILPKGIVAQEMSFERWIKIPEAVRDVYKLWRPTPVYRAKKLEEYLSTPAEIYFKYEGSCPTGSHKLNSALAQAYIAKISGVKRLVTDTGAGQWGCALSLACQLFGIEALVYMVRASYHHKPYRRHFMETYGATVLPSPGPYTEFGRNLLAERPNHPGSEGTAVSEALETVMQDPGSRFSMGAFGNHVLMHQTVIGLETQEQLEEIDKKADFLIAPVGCGSNMGGFVFPWIEDKVNGSDIRLIASEPESCATLTKGEYRYDFADSSGSGPMVKTYTLGHDFVPPPIHAGGLRYHGCAPLIGLARDEGLIEAHAYPQKDIFEAGKLFSKLQGLLPAPETCHAIKTAIDVALECKEQDRKATIVFCFSGNGLLDLEAYGRFNNNELEDHEEMHFEKLKDIASKVA